MVKQHGIPAKMPPADSAIASMPARLTADGRALSAMRIASAGVSPGPDLVFLHEGLGSIGQWRDVPAALAQATGRPALVYDRWGYGGSQPFDRALAIGFMHDEARLLPDILDQAGIERAILVGHSDGGSIALLAAAASGRRIAAVVTLAAHVFVEDETIAGIEAAARAWETADLRQRLAKYHGPNTDSMFRGWRDIWLSPAFRAWNIEDALPRITCPVLAVQGSDDEYGTPRQLAAIKAGVGGPCETWLVPNCAHAPHHQAREPVLARIAAFVAAVLGPNPGLPK